MSLYCINHKNKVRATWNKVANRHLSTNNVLLASARSYLCDTLEELEGDCPVLILLLQQILPS